MSATCKFCVSVESLRIGQRLGVREQLRNVRRVRAGGAGVQCGSACFVFTAFFPKLLEAGRWTPQLPSCPLASSCNERFGFWQKNYKPNLERLVITLRLDEFLMFGGMSCHWSLLFLEAKKFVKRTLQTSYLTNFSFMLRTKEYANTTFYEKLHLHTDHI